MDKFSVHPTQFLDVMILVLGIVRKKNAQLISSPCSQAKVEKAVTVPLRLVVPTTKYGDGNSYFARVGPIYTKVVTLI